MGLRIISLLIPYAFLVYAIYTVYKNPVFLLGIPFLMAMEDALFASNLYVLQKPGSWSLISKELLWAIIIWVIFIILKTGKSYEWKKENNSIGIFGKQKLAWADCPVLLLIALLVVNIVRSFWYDDIAQVLNQSADMGALIIGYFIIRGIITNSTDRQIANFLKFIILLNLVASLLYLAPHILGIDIYNDVPNSTATFSGILITRSFWYLSPFLSFTPVYVLAKQKWDAYHIGAFLLSLLVIFYTYSIMRISMVVILIITSFLLRVIKKGTIIFWFRRTLTSLIVLGAFIWGVTLILPKQSAFFLTRFQPYLYGGNPLQQDTNLSFRNVWIQRTWLFLTRNDNVLLGNGFLSDQRDPNSFYVTEWTADNVWVGILYRMGIIGVLLFLSLYVLWGVRALRLYLANSGEQQILGIIFFLLIIAEFIEGLTSFAFLDPRGCVVGLWYFAFLSAVVSRATLEI